MLLALNGVKCHAESQFDLKDSLGNLMSPRNPESIASNTKYLCFYKQDDVVKEIAMGCSSLLYLNISHCDVSDAGLRSLSR